MHDLCETIGSHFGYKDINFCEAMKKLSDGTYKSKV